MITRKCDCGSDTFIIEQSYDWKHLWCKDCGMGVSIPRHNYRRISSVRGEWGLDFKVENLAVLWNDIVEVYKMSWFKK